MILTRRRMIGLMLAPLLVGTRIEAQGAQAGGASPSRAPRRLPGGAPLEFGPAEAFDFEALVRLARNRLAQPYAPAEDPAPDVLPRIGYEQHAAIYQPARKGLFAGGPRDGAVSFFHLSELQRRPVRVFALQNGSAREVLYRPEYFSFPEDSPAADMPDGAGFAGIRVHEPGGGGGQPGDWLAFLGASYFRSSGDLKQYGISARGLALDTAAPDGGPEEFPDFARFYVTPMEGGVITIHALLEGPSVTGAFRFETTHYPHVVMDVTARLFLRNGVQRLGLAPLTSMYWHSQEKRWLGDDFRPEIHDSDGLLIRRAGQAPLFRPLTNPARVTVQRFSAANISSFSLVQRDRNFENYQDRAAFERRPNLVVELVEGFGTGAVELVELPTEAEYGDNIVAFFVPDAPAVAGGDYALRYRLRWSGEEPSSPLARLTDLRFGPERENARAKTGPRFERKIVADFSGPSLAAVRPRGALIRLTASSGRVFRPSVRRREAAPDIWRVECDLFTQAPAREAGKAMPVDLSLQLVDGETVLSEAVAFRVWPDTEKN